MLRLALAAVLTIQLGGGFGAASASVVSRDYESMILDLEVEVRVPAESVMAHLTAPGQPPLTLPLLMRDPGAFGIRTELPIIDYQVVFEALGEVSSQSQAVSLSELGADLGTGATPTTPGTEGVVISEETSGWGWLALGLGAASLSALAFWALGGDDRRKRKGEADGEESGTEAV